MKVLFFTYDFPYPTNSGGKTRAYNLLKFARSRDIEIHLFSFHREHFDKKNLTAINTLGVDEIKLFRRRPLKHISNIPVIFSPYSIFHKLYYDTGVKKILRKTIIDEKIDIVHFESLYTACYLPDVVDLPVKTVFGTENIEYKLYEEYTAAKAPLPLRPFFASQTKKIKREEEKYVKLADSCVSVTEQEEAWIHEFSDRPSRVIPNGVDLQNFTYQLKKHDGRTNLLFIGDFSYFPNVDAITYFYNKIFRTMTFPHLTLTVIGKRSTTLPIVQDKNVKAIEYVPDIRDAYRDADIFIAPVRIGGGTNFKIIEAMALGTPVIALPQRLGGLGVIHTKHLIIAKNEREFVHGIMELVNKEPLRERLTKNARQLVETHFSWEEIGRKLNIFWKTL